MSEGAAEEGYVLSMLAEAADRADRFAGRLEAALAQAESVQQSIAEALDRMHGARARYKQVRGELSKALEVRDDALGRAAEADEVAERAERRLTELRQMLEFGVEDEELYSEMGRAGVVKDDKLADRAKFRDRADKASRRAQDSETLMADLKLQAEARASEVKELQKRLPDPHLFAYLGLAHLARANAHFLLKTDASIFDRLFREGAGQIRRMHQELRDGRYRLDRYGDLLAGRHEASVQAMYGAVAVGDLKLGTELFALVADPGMFFHQIFNVYRVWLLGAYLLGDRRVLNQLLRTHRYDRGLWRGYGRCFVALLEGHAPEFNHGLRTILKLEQRDDEVARIPGLQLVHLPALALARLARLKKLPLTIEDRRLPIQLLDW